MNKNVPETIEGDSVSEWFRNRYDAVKTRFIAIHDADRMRQVEVSFANIPLATLLTKDTLNTILKVTNDSQLQGLFIVELLYSTTARLEILGITPRVFLTPYSDWLTALGEGEDEVIISTVNKQTRQPANIGKMSGEDKDLVAVLLMHRLNIY